jgi:ferredoxin
VPGLGRLLKWRHARTALQIPLFAIALALVVDGFTGSPLAPKNSATVITWVHYRGALVLALFAAGNLFCLACPFMLPRNLARRFVRPPLRWPRALRNKWLAVALTAALLFAYELFDLWGDPWWTAALIAGYFGAALVIDALFQRASFCKFVCPVGQFNFLASTASPLEVRVREPRVCASCATLDCIRGTPATPARPAQRGCELALFQPRKVGNLDCTFCLDCVQACPHDNVGIRARVPASELFVDPFRSGLGRLSQRADFGALAAVFAFGALLNAFAMVSPVYALEAWLARAMGVSVEWPVLGLLFVVALVVEPVALLGLAAWGAKRWAGLDPSVLRVATRYAWTLVPFGFGVWLAHYAFHFLTGFFTFVPVLQNGLARLGWPILGPPNWRLSGVTPEAALPIELGFLGVGLVYSLGVLARAAAADRPGRAHAIVVPWAALLLVLAAAAVWLLHQPMEMRGTVLAG